MPTSSPRSTTRVTAEIDEATDEAETSPFPEPLDALDGVYADPPREPAALVPRRRCAARWTKHERPVELGGRTMAEVTYLEAIREALFEEMERDARRLLHRRGHRRLRRRVQGHRRPARPVRRGARHRHADLRERLSSARRPARRTWACGRSCEMQFIDFISCAYDMLTNYVATARYRAFLPCPMVVRGPSGGYVRGGPFHSQNPEAGFLHTPGLKIVYPATACDAKGLLKAAIRDDDCVLFFEHKYLYRRIKEELPAGRPRRADRQGAAGARGQGPLDHHLRGDGVEGARGRGAAGAGGRALGRGDRPALAAAAGRRGDRRRR